MKNIAIFASGSGSNAENIIKFFENNNDVNINLILANSPDAFVLERAKRNNVDSFVFTRKEFNSTDIVINKLKEYDIDFIVLAGFLLLVPEKLVKLYPNKIINIHPALLPKYGGKGMYGDVVHKAVKEAGDKESGITIHYVNENYDEGNIIFQANCRVEENDTPDTIAEKVHELEYEHFPNVINMLMEEN